MIFQSTRPVRGATTGCPAQFIAGQQFQSTRPVRGATPGLPSFSVARPISIHAPRAGRDREVLQCPDIVDDFNPRAPCGARRGGLLRIAQHRLFQSTRPVRGATRIRANIITSVRFQSTRPVRGATSAAGLGQVRDDISIHAPRAGRDVVVKIDEHRRYISIHAPRAGRDCMRPPAGGTVGISIHAPRAGRDPYCHCGAKMDGENFNPRAPCGARRRSGRWPHRCRTYFNPRAPCGARRITTGGSAWQRKISIHAPRAGRDAHGVLPAVDVVRISIHAPRAGRD